MVLVSLILGEHRRKKCEDGAMEESRGGEQDCTVRRLEHIVGEIEPTVEEEETSVEAQEPLVGDQKHPLGEWESTEQEWGLSVKKQESLVGEWKHTVEEQEPTDREWESLVEEQELPVGKQEQTVVAQETPVGEGKSTVGKQKPNLGDLEPVVGEYRMGVLLDRHKENVVSLLDITNREGREDRVWIQESDLLRRRKHRSRNDAASRGASQGEQ